MRVLGIETSCDETSVAIVSETEILYHTIYSQIEEHRHYGGVIPEFAARAHVQKLPYLIEPIKDQLSSLDAITVTIGPGLIGGLLIGYYYAQALAFSLNIPCYGVNHLEGHALTVRMTHHIDFPYLLLLISGGHCQIIDVQNFRKYKILGQTIDDSCGELFDKTAQLMDLSYPGGPAVEQIAKTGNPHAFTLPHPLIREKNCNFSFSGLKTAVRQLYQTQNPDKADLAASLQHTVSKILINRLNNALAITDHHQIVVAGGVAANQYIRGELESAIDKTFIFPPINLCTDNAAMIAWIGIELLQRNIQPDSQAPRPRWPLDEVTLNY